MHLTGFKTMFTTIINNYARELNILKEKDVNFTGADVRNGMTAVVSIKHPAPRFEGQTKTKLDNQDAAKAVSKVTGDEVPRYFDRLRRKSCKDSKDRGKSQNQYADQAEILL